MKKSQLILKVLPAFFLALILSANVSQAGNNPVVEVQYIAIHFGNIENATVIDETEFPAFKFYATEGDVYSYYERTKMMKNPAFYPI